MRGIRISDRAVSGIGDYRQPGRAIRRLLLPPRLAYGPAMRTRLLLLLVGLAGCARPATVSGDDFARVIAGRTAGQAQSCVVSRANQGLRAVDSMTLAYGLGRTVYINRLGGSCPGLRELSTIIVDGGSGRFCRGDRIRAIEPGSIIPGPTCNLGEWVPYKIR